MLDRKAQANMTHWGREEGGFDDAWIGSAPVGGYRANAFGLFDVHGNVWEWTRDAYGIGPPRSGDGLRHDGDRSSPRVYRGGSFSNPARFARAAARIWNGPAVREPEPRRAGGQGRTLTALRA